MYRVIGYLGIDQILNLRDFHNSGVPVIGYLRVDLYLAAVLFSLYFTVRRFELLTISVRGTVLKFIYMQFYVS